MRKFLFLLVAVPVWAQTGGLPPEWEVRNQLTALAQHVERFQPLLEKIDPETWEGKPAGYAGQVKRVRAEIGYLVGSAKALMHEPERLTLALETYFRMQAVDEMLRSLEAGIRKYQNAAVADLVQALLADETTDREKLRGYIVELAADREQQLRIIDQEAQRCRAALARQPRSSENSAQKKERR